MYVVFSIKDIFHERAWLRTSVFSVRVSCFLFCSIIILDPRALFPSDRACQSVCVGKEAL